MCGIHCKVEDILMSSLTDEQKEKRVKAVFNGDLSYNDFITDIEDNFDFDSIGKSYETKESDMLHFYSIPKTEHQFRVINLYKYEPQPGEAPIQNNTRRFCRQLYLRTQDESNYLTYREVQSLANPGAPYGVSDILTFCGNFTKDLKYVNCRHRWIRYKYDQGTGNIVRDVNQPRYV